MEKIKAFNYKNKNLRSTGTYCTYNAYLFHDIQQLKPFMGQKSLLGKFYDNHFEWSLLFCTWIQEHLFMHL